MNTACRDPGSVNLLHPGRCRCDISESALLQKSPARSTGRSSLIRCPCRARKASEGRWPSLDLLPYRRHLGAHRSRRFRVRSCQRLQKLNARSMSLPSHVSPTSRAFPSAEIRSLLVRALAQGLQWCGLLITEGAADCESGDCGTQS